MSDSPSDNETVGSAREVVRSAPAEERKDIVITTAQSLPDEERKDIAITTAQSLPEEALKALIQTLQRGASPVIFDEKVLDPWVKVIDRHSEMAQKDVYATIPSILGIVALVLALTVRFVPSAAWAVGLSSSDFMAILLTGTLLIITGAVVRLFSFKWQLRYIEAGIEKPQLIAKENRTESVGTEEEERKKSSHSL